MHVVLHWSTNRTSTSTQIECILPQPYIYVHVDWFVLLYSYYMFHTSKQKRFAYTNSLGTCLVQAPWMGNQVTVSFSIKSITNKSCCLNTVVQLYRIDTGHWILKPHMCATLLQMMLWGFWIVKNSAWILFKRIWN